tara:strand:+ start:39310 stop:40026 length:717 start_codon:yes stop_codon:yes gene_type:complete
MAIIAVFSLAATCHPKAEVLLPTGRIYLPEDEIWSGNQMKARLFGAEEVHHRDLHYLAEHILYLRLELDYSGQDLGYLNCYSRDEQVRSEFDKSLEETGLSRARPEEKRQMTYDRFQNSRGLLHLELQARDLALRDRVYESYQQNGRWWANCTGCYSPATAGTLPQEGPGIWLWPGRRALVRISCRVPDGTYPVRLTYLSQWSFAFNPIPRYTNQSSEYLDGLEFQQSIIQDFSRRTP